MKTRLIEIHHVEERPMYFSNGMKTGEMDTIPFITRKLQKKIWWGWKTVSKHTIRQHMHDWITSCTMGDSFIYAWPEYLGSRPDKVIYR